MSPFGHVATPRIIIDRGKGRPANAYMLPPDYDVERDPLNYGGKFYGWDPYRKEIPNEHNYALMQKESHA